MKLLTVEDVAAMLSLSEFTVREMARDGNIPAVKLRGKWRFLSSDIEATVKKMFNNGDDVSPGFSEKENTWQSQNEVKPGIHVLQHRTEREYSNLVKPSQRKRHKNLKTH